MTSLISEFSYFLRKLEEIEKHFKVHTLSPNEKKVVHTIVELKTKNKICNITDVAVSYTHLTLPTTPYV